MLGIRRNSLSYKTALLYIILTVLIISVFNFIIWENQSDLITRNQQLVFETQSIKLKEILHLHRERLGGQPAEAFAQVAGQLERENVAAMVAYSEAGKVLFRKGHGNPQAASPEELALINRSIAKYELEDKGFYHDIDIEKGHINLYVPVPTGADKMVVFKFPLIMTNLEDDKNVLLRLCLFVTLVIILLQFIFAMFLRKMIIVPISKLEKVTHAVSKGDFNQTIDIKQDDEIGLLASSFNEMTISLTQIRDEAKGANPLTGLPGNNIIVKKIEDSIREGTEFAVIYADLDNFKAYNDKYGFSKGDDAILYTRDCFQDAAKRFGDGETFVGHEGGDDFVIICSYATWEPLCKGIISAFDGGIAQFYSEVDAKQGFIDSMDRQGKRVRFPLISISLAVASNHYRKITDHRAIVQTAAEMKKFVKKTEGSTYAIDKRTN